MKISLIAAISENRVIGRDNALPWHIPEDLKRFKEITKGHPVIMGRKTYESIGRLLPNRINIIITRDSEYTVDGAVIVHSLEDAMNEASKPRTMNQELRTDKDEAFVIGGGQIFEQAITIAEKLYLTVVHTEIEGDAFFPDYSEFSTVVEKRDSHNEMYSYTFLDLEK
jgi:dihydrofolate reductase